MKKYSVLIVIALLFVGNLQAELNTIPRYSWGIPIEKKVKGKKEVLFTYGVTTNNLGIIFEDTAGDRHKHRTWSIGPSGGIYFGLGKSLILGASGTVSYNFHYKHKIFPNGERKDKIKNVQEWFSDKVEPFNLIPRLSIGLRDKFVVYGEYYLTGLFNKNYTDDAGFKPFEGFEITRFNIGISTDLNNKFVSNEEILEPENDVSL
jgi:hypothetical protein